MSRPRGILSTASFLLLLATAALAQEYPVKPVVIVVPAAKATPESLRVLLKSEVEKWTPIIRKTGVFAD